MENLFINLQRHNNHDLYSLEILNKITKELRNINNFVKIKAIEYILCFLPIERLNNIKYVEYLWRILFSMRERNIISNYNKLKRIINPMKMENKIICLELVVLCYNKMKIPKNYNCENCYYCHMCVDCKNCHECEFCNKLKSKSYYTDNKRRPYEY